VNKIAIPNNKIVELEKGQVINQINLADIHTSVQKLLMDIEKSKINMAIVHVKGNNTESDVKKIIDYFEKLLPHATIKEIITKEKLPDTLVECIFFGDFEPEEEY
jgi:hypothetical protein